VNSMKRFLGTDRRRSFLGIPVVTEFAFSRTEAAIFASRDSIVRSRVGHDQQLLAVRIFQRNVLQVNGRALGVKAATDDTRVVSKSPSIVR
jgi:hypothetical protein